MSSAYFPEFPPEWSGEHIRDMFGREVIEPRKQGIVAWALSVGILGPALLIIGAVVPGALVAHFAGVLFIIGMLLLRLPGVMNGGTLKSSFSEEAKESDTGSGGSG
jgi:hypothetical protein